MSSTGDQPPTEEPAPGVPVSPAPAAPAITTTAPPPAQVAANQANTWAMFCHLASFSVYLTGAGLVLGPLIVWLIKKDEFEFVDDQGKEALNFNISLAIYGIAGLVLAFTIIGLIIAIPLWIALALGHIVFTIIAAVQANSGQRYRYPLTIRLVK